MMAPPWIRVSDLCSHRSLSPCEWSGPTPRNAWPNPPPSPGQRRGLYSGSRFDGGSVQSRRYLGNRRLMVRLFRAAVNEPSREKRCQMRLTRGPSRTPAKAPGQLRNQLLTATSEPNGRTLGLPGIAKQLSFKPHEPLRRCEEAVAFRSSHNDARRLRGDFDNVGIRHACFPGASLLKADRQPKRPQLVPAN